MAGGWGNLIGELLAHGDDIARATGVPFTIPSADLEVLWRFTPPALQGWLRPEAEGLTESWRLTFPFGALDAVFDRRSFRWGPDLVDEPTYRFDVADAAAFALTFPYRRRPITDPLVALLASRFYDL